MSQKLLTSLALDGVIKNGKRVMDGLIPSEPTALCHTAQRGRNISADGQRANHKLHHLEAQGFHDNPGGVMIPNKV